MKIQNSFRKTGAIQPVLGNKIPSNLLFLDTETKSKKLSDKSTEQVFKLGVLIYVSIDQNATPLKRSVYTFTELSRLQDMIFTAIYLYKEVYLFGHNIGFDLRVINLFHYLHDLGFSSKPPIINERAFIWTASVPNHKLTVLDTANFAVHSVKQLGKDMGYSKIDVNFTQVSDNELMTYCIRDTEIVEKFVCSYIKFIRENDLGNFKTTLASQALLAWRHRFMTAKVILHSNKTAIDAERDSYHGGRVECFHIGVLPKQLYYNLDINSMYPFIMSTMKLPFRLENISNENRIKTLHYWVQKRYVIAKVIVETNTPCYPVYFNKRLVFPVGKFAVTLHNEEIKQALLHNEIKYIEKVYIYNSGILFKDYVDFFYSVKVSSKLNGNSSWEFIAKILLNALYGKFGQTYVSRVITDIADTNQIWRLPYSIPENKSRGQYVCWYDKLMFEQKQGETSHSFPAIAGSITAYARMLLWSYIERAQLHNVYYADTDSLIVNESGYRNLLPYISSTQLGMLKLVSQSEYLEIRGCKDYQFGEEDKTKGKRKDAIVLSPNSWEQSQFEGILQWMNKGAAGGPVVTQIIKHRTGRYDKGIILPDGSVMPYELRL